MRSQFVLLICLIPLGCLDSRRGSRTTEPDTHSSDTLPPDTLTPDVVAQDTSLADADDADTRPATACESPCSSGETCHRDGYPGDDGTVYYCAPPALVGKSCTNQFNEYHHPCADGLLCLAPFPDDDDTVRLCTDCRPQDFTVTGACDMAIGVFWDGQTCIFASGCSCAGSACTSPYPSLERCHAAVARPCSAVGR